MGFLISIWNGIKDGLELVLRFYEGLLEPFLGPAAWGVAIILLTVTVRVFMIPLMVRQTKSMRAMQTVQPEMKKIQEKYKADRSMMKTDPERYKKIKEKQREAQMELYQEHGVNPVGGCLPLLLQMPVFLALFQVLQQPGPLKDDLASASFLGFRSLTDTAQSILTGGETGLVLGAAISAVTLIALQVGTTYWSQKQMMARNTTAAAEQAQVQKMMLYVMPFFLGFLSFTFPIGVVLYWVTTNFWTMGQQAIIFRQVEAQEVRKAEERDAAKDAAKKEKAQRRDRDVSPDDAAGPRGADKTGSKGGKGGKPSSSGSGTGAKGSGAKGSGNRASSAKAGSKAPAPKGSGAEAEDDGASGNGRKTPGSGRPRGSGRPGKSPVEGGASKDDSNGNGSKGATAAGEDGARPTRRSTRRSRAPQDGVEGDTTARNGRSATSGGPAGSPPGNRARPKGNRSKPGSAR